MKRLINEKMKKLEESYTENIIPNLEKKISHLEKENKYFEERARLLQKNLTTLLDEYRKQLQVNVTAVLERAFGRAFYLIKLCVVRSN